MQFRSWVFPTFVRTVEVVVEAADRQEAEAVLSEALVGVQAEDIDHPRVRVIGIGALEWERDGVGDFEEIEEP